MENVPDQPRGDFLDGFLAETAKGHHAIQTIEKFRREKTLGGLRINAGFVGALRGKAQFAGGFFDAQVRGQNQNGIAEIGCSSQRIGQPSIAHHL